MAQTLTRLLVHIVFSTRDRAPLISPELEPELLAYIGGICRGSESPLLAAGAASDHVHLLVSMSKSTALKDLVLAIKRDSSAWVKERHATLGRFYWQEGYSAFSIDETGIPALRSYFSTQREHHRDRSFKEELLDILHRYGVEHDERYLWG